MLIFGHWWVISSYYICFIYAWLEIKIIFIKTITMLSQNYNFWVNRQETWHMVAYSFTCY